MTVYGGASLSSDNHAAIVAQGDVRILGSDSQRSYFNGLIWTGGQGCFPDQDRDLDLVLQDVTVQGCVVNAGKGSSGLGSSMQVDRARVFYDEAGTQVILEPGFSGEWPIRVGTGDPRSPNGFLSLRQVTENGKTFTPGPAYFARRGTPLEPADFVFTDNSGQVFQAAADGTVPRPLEDAYDAGTVQAAATDWQSEIDAAKQDTTDNGVFKLDLNEFLQAADRLKVIYRKPN